MAEDPQRNFRSAYYEKVGFRGVEEKKSLEILLKDNPLGKRNCLPSNYSYTVVLFPIFPVFFTGNMGNKYTERSLC